MQILKKDVSNHYSCVFIFGAFCGLSFISIAIATNYANIKDSFFKGIALSNNSYIPVIHFPSNCYFLWKIPTALGTFNQTQYFILLYAVLAIGSLLSLASYQNRTCVYSSILSLSFATIVYLTLILTFGLDLVVLSAVTSIPWVFIAISTALESSGFKGTQLLKLVVPCILIMILAQQFALLIVSAVVIVYPAFSFNNHNPKKLQSARVITFGLLLGFVLALLAPTPNIAPYTSHAHLAPLYGTTSYSDPRFGIQAVPPIFNHDYEKSRFIIISLITLLISLCCFKSLKSHKAPLQLILAGVITSIMLLLDSSLFLPAINFISPIQTLKRIVPGYSWLPLSDCVGAINCIIGLSLIWFCMAQFAKRFVLLLAVASVYVLSGDNATGSNSSDSLKAWNDLLSRPWQEDILLSKLISPSYFLINSFGNWTVIEKQKVQQFSKLTSYIRPKSILASHQQKLTKNINDNNPETRWTSGQAGQRANEWLHLDLGKEFRLAGLNIESGLYVTDFPRGVSVYISRSCTPDSTPGNLEEILSIPHWQGPIKYTKNGFPYFGSQQQVKIIFPDTIQARCLLLRQTGRTKDFDWSVSGIKIITPKGGKES